MGTHLLGTRIQSMTGPLWFPALQWPGLPAPMICGLQQAHPGLAQLLPASRPLPAPPCPLSSPLGCFLQGRGSLDHLRFGACIPSAPRRRLLHSLLAGGPPDLGPLEPVACVCHQLLDRMPAAPFCVGCTRGRPPERTLCGEGLPRGESWGQQGPQWPCGTCQCFVPFQGQVIFHTVGPPLCSCVTGPLGHVCFGAAGEPSTGVCGG